MNFHGIIERVSVFAAIGGMTLGMRYIISNASVPATEWNAIFVPGSLILVALAVGVVLVFHKEDTLIPFRSFGPVERILGAWMLMLTLVAVWNFGTLVIFRFLLLVWFIFFAFLVRFAVRHIGLDEMLWIFLIAALIQSTIGIAQFFLQHDLGLRMLGESPIGPQYAGVARFITWNSKVARAYGTLPHPNVLAAYLASAFLVVAMLLVRNAKHRMMGTRDLFVFYGAAFVLVFGLLVTFSRSALVGFAIAVPICFLTIRFGPRLNIETYRSLAGLGLAIFIAVAIFGVGLLPFWLGRTISSIESKAFTERIFYAKSALAMIHAKPIFGVGLGRFSDVLPEFVSPKPVAVPSVNFPLWLLQPVHNIYLLLAAETGLLALALFMAFVATLLKGALRTGASSFAAAGLIVLLVIGVFDHFLFTTVQGGLLFWFFVGILMADKRKDGEIRVSERI